MQTIGEDKFNTILEVRAYLDASIQAMDLEQRNPPFTSQLYHPLRKRIFQNYVPLAQAETREQRDEILYQLVQVVDEEYLNLFQMLLAQPFQELIMVKHYHIPREIDLEEAQKNSTTVQAMQYMVACIAEWNIQIERIMDHINRVQLYKLWSPRKMQAEGQLNAELKALLAPDSDFNYNTFTKHVLLNLLSQGADKFGKFLYHTSIAESNLSFGAVLLIYHTLVGGSALPWHVIAPTVNLQWLFGGMVGSLALGKMANYINNQDAVEQLMAVGTVFKEISLNLVNFSETLIDRVNACLLCVDEEEEVLKKAELSTVIDAFLEEPQNVREAGKAISAKNMIELQDGEWTVFDVKKQ